jgi:hypothetical protein
VARAPEGEEEEDDDEEEEEEDSGDETGDARRMLGVDEANRALHEVRLRF